MAGILTRSSGAAAAASLLISSASRPPFFPPPPPPPPSSSSSSSSSSLIRSFPIRSIVSLPNKKRLFLLRTFCCSSSSSSSSSSSQVAAASVAAETTSTASVDAADADVPLPSPSVPSDPIKEAADALDIRVGRVLKAWRHPEADSLYVEEVDLGEPEPRTICSGLVNYIPLDDLQDVRVVVLANLKPRNMRGIKSNGMLMAASDASHENVELLLPPEGSIPGERIWFGSEEERGNQLDAATPNQIQKKKIWESVQPHLKTTDSCVATLGIHPMRTSAGVVTCKSLKNANIS